MAAKSCRGLPAELAARQVVKVIKTHYYAKSLKLIAMLNLLASCV